MRRDATRRDFLGTSAAVAAVGLTATRSVASAADDTPVRIALIGCGGRGTGAAHNALSTAGPVRLVAMADVFEDRLEASLKQLQSAHSDRLDVPPERRFLGLDAYAHAIEAVGPGGLVLLTTPPAFRPGHLEAAVAAGCHVFMEKSFAVDAPGIRRVLAAGEAAKAKNLKVAGGLMSRHSTPLEQAIEQIHAGAIGDVVACWAYRMHGPVGFRPRKEGESELQHQIRNYSCFTWLNGGFLLDWLIHNLDVCCWVKGAWPVAAQGQGGRQVRDAPDQMYDHMAVEYEFADGSKLMAQARHMDRCWGFFGDQIQGTTGLAVLGEGIKEPKLYRGWKADESARIWAYAGEPTDAYQKEHDLLFDAIRNDEPYNEAERCAYAALTGILGRMAYESGKRVTWDEALHSEVVLAPRLDQITTMASDPPVSPGPDGRYPIAEPGSATVF
jgi:predicted dehydrogenase